MINKLKIFVITIFLCVLTNNAYTFDKKGSSSFINEIKTGVVAHDVGFFGTQKEEGRGRRREGGQEKVQEGQEEKVQEKVQGRERRRRGGVGRQGRVAGVGRRRGRGARQEEVALGLPEEEGVERAADEEGQEGQEGQR